MDDKMQRNAEDLEVELLWFAQVMNARFKSYLGEEAEAQDVFEVRPPDLSASQSEYAKFLRYYEFAFAERFTVMLALVPHIRPQLLDVFFTKNSTFDRKFTEFGGIRQGAEGDFFPTGETLQFILA
ncbi:MAG: ATP-binding protein, partial [Nitrospirota bacterium]|nr:ATP-binding protein [Nitrospirota bacterium]